MKIGILDIGALPDLLSTENVIEHTVSSVQLAESLGYSKYWLGEHHSFNCAWRSPELMIQLLGNYSQSINIGAAGILLPIHSPLIVAQNFKFLNMLYPNRVDLGFCKGYVNSNTKSEIISNDEFINNIENHHNRIIKTVKFLSNKNLENFEKDNKQILVPPYNSSIPNIWLLGSSLPKKTFLEKNNFNFCLSLFHSDKVPNEDEFKFFFQNLDMSKTSLAISISGIVRNNISKAIEMSKIVLNSSALHINFIGNSEMFVDFLFTLNKKYNVKEFVFLNLDLNLEEKFKSYQYIANNLKVLES